MKTGALLACALLFASQARAERSSKLDTATIIILGAVPIGLLAWDGYLALKDAKMESTMIRDAAWRASAIPYAIGFVAGHWFLNLHESREELFLIGLTSVAMVGLLDLAARGEKGRPAWKYPGIWLGLGIAAGALTWGMQF